MKLTVVLAVLLGMAATGEALKCYTCKGKETSTTTADGKVKSDAKLCSTFKKEEAFEYTCPDTHNKSCVKIVKGDDVMRGCSSMDKNMCTKDNKNSDCYCKKDLCNAAGQGWPSLVLMISAVGAALLGTRR